MNNIYALISGRLVAQATGRTAVRPEHMQAFAAVLHPGRAYLYIMSMYL